MTLKQIFYTLLNKIYKVKNTLNLKNYIAASGSTTLNYFFNAKLRKETTKENTIKLTFKFKIKAESN